MGILLWSSTLHDVASRWCAYKFWNQVGKTFSLPRFEIGREVTRREHSVAVCSPLSYTRSWTCFLFVVTLCMSHRFTGLRSAPHLLDCKSQLVICYTFFHHFVWLASRAAFIIYLFSSSKSRDGALSFLLRFVNQTFFGIFFSSASGANSVTGGIMVNRRRQLWWCKHHYQDCQLNAKRANAWKYLIGWGILSARAVHINF